MGVVPRLRLCGHGVRALRRGDRARCAPPGRTSRPAQRTGRGGGGRRALAAAAPRAHGHADRRDRAHVLWRGARGDRGVRRAVGRGGRGRAWPRHRRGVVVLRVLRLLLRGPVDLGARRVRGDHPRPAGRPQPDGGAGARHDGPRARAVHRGLRGPPGAPWHAPRAHGLAALLLQDLAIAPLHPDARDQRGVAGVGDDPARGPQGVRGRGARVHAVPGGRAWRAQPGDPPGGASAVARAVRDAPRAAPANAPGLQGRDCQRRPAR